VYKNYFLFEKQVEQIRPIILQREVNRCFSSRKNEIVFELNADAPIHLRISVDSRYPYILLDKPSGLRSPAISLFSSLIGEKIREVSIEPFDKSISILFTSYTVQVIFFGKNPALLLYDQNGKLIDNFKQPPLLVKSENVKLYDFRTITIEEIIKIIDQDKETSKEELLLTKFGGLNKILIREILYRCMNDPKFSSKKTAYPSAETLHDTLKNITRELRLSIAYLYGFENTVTHISLIRFLHLEAQDYSIIKEYQSINEAWRRFLDETKHLDKYKKQLSICQNALTKRKTYLQDTLNKIKRREDLEKLKTEAELKGNLLLTFQNDIKPGKSKVRLKNILSDAGEMIDIRLKPNKTIVANAMIYFNKYKESGEQTLARVIKKETLEYEFGKINTLFEETNTSIKPANLIKLHKKLIEMRLIQDSTPAPQTKIKSASTWSFKNLVLEKEWNIFIGKSGQNNDLLTFNFANKWDIWFHVQGVPGSHVIIHLPNKRIKPPDSVLERTAQIAAANSKAKHSTSVPVIYTEVRHIHRVRKAAPGTVSVQNEKVIFVKPLSIR